MNEYALDRGSDMKPPATIGRWLFAAAIAGFGAQFLLFAAGQIGNPGGPWIAVQPPEAWVTGIVLIAGGTAIAARWQVRWAALLLALVFVRVLLVHFPHLVANLRNPGPWTAGFEIFGLLCVTLVLWGEGTSGRLTTVSGVLLGLALAVFGVQHFLYPGFVAGFMPAGIPVRQFWAYAAAVGFLSAGLCFVAAPVSGLARRLAPLAATLLGVMFLLFALSVHLFRILAAPHTVQEWTSGMVAVAWCGGSWILAEAMAKAPAGSTPG